VCVRDRESVIETEIVCVRERDSVCERVGLRVCVLCVCG
jgi:hypothetical protein